MIRIGILSDTHISQNTETFRRQVNRAFHNCDMIIHAGDLTDISILEAFSDKQVHAVSGNMCNLLTHKTLPESRCIVIEGYLFCICHGADGPKANIEERLYARFAEADCIVYGHTHIATCHTIGTTMIMNPGSFQSTGRYGSPGTYGIITIDEQGLHGSIQELDTSLT